ncbi:hypothetical protein BN1012_Phect2471 [Candidatus Phaeomarinobacter ectocarpi]|uniref:PepSY domain-containing protein n=2 Tax=Candidatus Phaeomarinibacter ectocarpi TaxID=1458461 RepID=X5MGN6_9HYPH|nr:hypothetical protein BN1012_Phect2471 [Candidatus Phaeomarinobacter ectocarpi]
MHLMWTTIKHKSAIALLRSGLAALLALSLFAALPAHADSHNGFLPLNDNVQSQERTNSSWRVVQNGDVLPLETVLGIARREIGGGELLEVDLNDRTGVYRLKLIRANDSVVDVIVDGKSGRVLRVHGR